jgi:hypothetical protein
MSKQQLIATIAIASLGLGISVASHAAPTPSSRPAAVSDYSVRSPQVLAPGAGETKAFPLLVIAAVVLAGAAQGGCAVGTCGPGKAPGDVVFDVK